MKKRLFMCCVFVIIAFLLKQIANNWNFDKSFGENMIFGTVGVQLTSLAFCLTSSNFERIDLVSGHMAEKDYLKQSIYSILYNLYDWVGVVKSPQNISYQFTFNTWGFGPSLYSNNEPQRFGMTAYKSLTLFNQIQHDLKEIPENSHFKILEVGSGTGAGANLISSELQRDFKHINITYFAVDMQLAAINTCKRRHEINNPSLRCIQGNGKQLSFEPDTFDMVLISETHIAELSIDDEAKVIIDEIIRVLKHNAYFVWGNALLTKVWKEIIDYLPTRGFESCGINDVTDGAVQARLDDAERLDKWVDEAWNKLYAFYFYPKCGNLARQLILNFARHPGTRLFGKMVNKSDSYMQICNQIKK